MSKGIGETIAGVGMIVAGVVVEIASMGTLTPLATLLVTAGTGMLLTGIGTLLTPGQATGLNGTTTRNPIAPWKVVYGRQRVGGTIVHMHMWGDSAKMLDLVIVLAAHACQSVDVLLFDQQRIQIDNSAAPGGVSAGSGTSFTPVQQTVNISRIRRVNDVVTVNLSANIPYLIAGDQINIAEDGAGTLTAAGLVGTFQVAEILSQIAGSPGSIVFTYLSGGSAADISGHGHVNTLWADYGRKVYIETLLGTQTLGQTFKGMSSTGTPYDGDKGNFVSPEHPGGLGGGSSSTPNPWTSNCSLVGKTAVFLRLHYNDQYFKGGLPQISFLVHGKNDIYDPRDSSHGYSENAALNIADFLSNKIWGFGAAYGTEIPDAGLIAAANACDEAVPLALSTASPPLTEPAYTCNGQFDLTMKRGEILQNMLTSCAGRLTYIGGQFTIWPAAWLGNSFAIGSNPGGGVVSLPDFVKIAAGPIKWRPTVSIRDLYNGVKGTFVSKDNKWQSTDFPPYAQDTLHGYSFAGPEGDANLAADGGDRRWLDIQLPFTISASTAQRIAKIELLRRRHNGTGTLPLNMVGYQLTPMDLLLITIPFLEWNAKQLEIIAARFKTVDRADHAPALVVEIDIQETDSSIYAWSTSEELTPQGYQQPAIPGIGSFQFFETENTPGYSVPFPWSPAYVAPLRGDALYPGPVAGSPPVDEGLASFGLQVQYSTAQGVATAGLLVKGSSPASQLSAINPPQITCVVGTSGSLPPGLYVIAASALDTGTPVANSRLSVPIPVTIPAGPSNGSIAITVGWPAGGNGGEVYVANGTAKAGYHFQAALSSATTTYTLTAFNQSTRGAPDPTFDHLAVAWKKVVHSGIWAQQVQAVTATTITIGGDGMTANMYANRTLSLLGTLDSTQELIILNMPVVSNTASSGTPAEFTLTIGPNSIGDQLPDLSTLLVVGDLVVMRPNATFTATSFSDTLFANPYFPSGDTGIESGHLAVVLTGPDAGDVQTIASLSLDGSGFPTTFNLAGTWEITPNAGDLVIVVEAGYGPENHSKSLIAPNGTSLSGVLAAPQVTNFGGQTWLVIVRTQAADDVNGDDAYAPVREIFLFGSQGTRTIAGDQTMLPTDRIIDADASGGSFTYTLLPFDQIPNQSIYVQKIDSGTNIVTVLAASGDLINGQSSVLLQAQDDFIIVVVPNG